MAAVVARGGVGRALRQVGAIGALMLGAACAGTPPAEGPRGPYLAERPEAYLGSAVGAGQCVDLIKVAAGAPRTGAWREGARVRGNRQLAPGTAIATFDADGTYASRSGSHAAIYLAQSDDGLWVYDQWRGQPVHKRLIRFEGGSGAKAGSKSNDGTRFAVIR